MRLSCPRCTTEFDLRPPGGGRRRAHLQFRCTECGELLGEENLSLEDSEDSPSEMPSVVGPVPIGADAGSVSGALPFEPPADPVVRRFQEELAQVADASGMGQGEGTLIKQEGKVYHVRDSATVQRWIVERRVLRDDLISTGGSVWEPVGQHPDLEVFFQMVERLEQLEQPGPTHSSGPPVPDGATLGNAWVDQEQGNPDEIPMETPDEEEEAEVIAPPSVLPSDDGLSGDGPIEPIAGLHSQPHDSSLGPTLGNDELAGDPDSFMDPLPFALRSTVRDDAAQPVMLTVPDVVVTEEAPLPSGEGLIGMVGPGDDEVTQGIESLATPALSHTEPLPNAENSNKKFDETAFFAAERGPLEVPDPEQPVKTVPDSLDPDELAWEVDRNQRRVRLGWCVGAVLVLVIIAAVYPVAELPGEPAGVEEQALDDAGEGTDPPGQASTSPDPAMDEGVDQPVQDAAVQATDAQAAADQAAADQAAADQAAADQAAADQAAADQAAADQAAADQAAADQAAADQADKATRERAGGDKERRARAEPRTKPKAPGVDVDDGWAAVQTGDYDKARLVFVEAVAMRPGDADAHYGLGYSAQRQGDDATAIRHYCKALKLAPENREIQQTATSLLSSLNATCS